MIHESELEFAFIWAGLYTISIFLLIIIGSLNTSGKPSIGKESLC